MLGARLREHGVAIGTPALDDVFMVINNWGALGGPADVNGNGIVDLDDLFQVINAWGNC